MGKSMMYCSKCGSDLRGNSNRCPTCGYSLNQMKLEDSQKRVGYRHSDIGRDKPVGEIKRDENGDPIIPHTDEWRKAKELEERPRVLTFRKSEEEN